MYKIEIYEDKHGKSEINEYIRELQKQKSKDSNIKIKKIISYIRMLNEKGLFIRKAVCKIHWRWNMGVETIKR